MLRKLLQLKDYLFSEDWSLMFKAVNDKNFEYIEQPDNVARADPFIVEYANKIFIFFEEFLPGPGRLGYIKAGELDIKSKRIINSKVILKENYHLSYPFVFRYLDEWYLIPESSQNLTIDLYKFSEFPYKLKKIKTLMEGICAVDNTLFFKDSFAYLFTNVKNQSSFSQNLSIFYSKSFLESKFVEHNLNPVSTNKKFSRMAGRIFYVDNNIFRFGQDCKTSYGKTLHKLCIKKLNKVNFLEEYCEEIKKPAGISFSHTYNRSENFEIIDVKKRNFSFRNIYNKAKRLLN